MNRFVEHYNERRANSSLKFMPLGCTDPPPENHDINLNEIACRKDLGGVIKPNRSLMAKSRSALSTQPSDGRWVYHSRRPSKRRREGRSQWVTMENRSWMCLPRGSFNTFSLGSTGGSPQRSCFLGGCFDHQPPRDCDF